MLLATVRVSARLVVHLALAPRGHRPPLTRTVTGQIRLTASASALSIPAVRGFLMRPPLLPPWRRLPSDTFAATASLDAPATSLPNSGPNSTSALPVTSIRDAVPRDVPTATASSPNSNPVLPSDSRPKSTPLSFSEVASNPNSMAIRSCGRRTVLAGTQSQIVRTKLIWLTLSAQHPEYLSAPPALQAFLTSRPM